MRLWHNARLSINPAETEILAARSPPPLKCVIACFEGVPCTCGRGAPIQPQPPGHHL